MIYFVLLILAVIDLIAIEKVMAGLKRTNKSRL